MEPEAHLSSVAAVADSSVPSVFEVIAQESLVSTLKPAMHHVLRISAERNPQQFGRLLAYYDELYIALHFLLENYYLTHYDASFSENFYGLRRVTGDGTSQGSVVAGASDAAVADDMQVVRSKVRHLTRTEQRRSLFFLVVVPYIKSKLDRCYEHLSESVMSLHHVNNLRCRLYRAFLAAYPLLHALWEGSVFYYHLAFMFGKSRCHSPFLLLANLMLRHLTDDEIVASQSPSMPLKAALIGKSWRERALIVVSRLLSWTVLVLSASLSTGIFFLQFLQWWYASDQRAPAMTSLPNPGPPSKQVAVTSGECRLANICPLCNKLRVNDTALSVSGYVFCYQCIFKFVRDKACCPVTGYPARADHLIRIYRSDYL